MIQYGKYLYLLGFFMISKCSKDTVPLSWMKRTHHGDITNTPAFHSTPILYSIHTIFPLCAMMTTSWAPKWLNRLTFSSLFNQLGRWRTSRHLITWLSPPPFGALMVDWSPKGTSGWSCKGWMWETMDMLCGDKGLKFVVRIRRCARPIGTHHAPGTCTRELYRFSCKA